MQSFRNVLLPLLSEEFKFDDAIIGIVFDIGKGGFNFGNFLPVPVYLHFHNGKDMDKGLLFAILKQAGLK